MVDTIAIAIIDVAKKQPDLLATFNNQLVLGGKLLDQIKHAEAERLLLKGYDGVKARESSIPPNGITRNPEYLVCLDEHKVAPNAEPPLQK